jgi:hypothetical protein
LQIGGSRIGAPISPRPRSALSQPIGSLRHRYFDDSGGVFVTSGTRLFSVEGRRAALGAEWIWTYSIRAIWVIQTWSSSNSLTVSLINAFGLIVENSIIRLKIGNHRGLKVVQASDVTSS